MRRLARRVGVTAPALYRHFENKDSLLQEITLAGLRTLGGYLEPALEAATPYDRLRGLTGRFLDFALEQPAHFDLAFLDPDMDRQHLAEEVGRPMWGTFRLAIEQISECMARGELKRDDPLETAIVIWAQAFGLITLYRTGRMGSDVEVFRAVYEGSVDRIFRGLKAPRAEAP